MKKMLFAYVALAFAATAGAMEELNPDTCTEAEIRAAMAEVLSVTNGQHWLCGVSNGLWRALNVSGRGRKPLRLEMDSAMIDKGIVLNGWWREMRAYPKESAAARARVGADVAFANTIAICERLEASLWPSSIVYYGGTLDDLMVFVSEVVAFPNTTTYWTVSEFENNKKTIQQAAVRAVKAYIRAQGKSFVTKNGVNPCETYMTGLTEALNAPRFAGLDAWLKSVGCKGVDLSKMPSEEDVAKLREDILYGRKDMTPFNKSILYVCLGVEGYNAFVREYNGD